MSPSDEASDPNAPARERRAAAIDRRGRLLGLLIVGGGLMAMSVLTDPGRAPASPPRASADGEARASEDSASSAPVLVELLGRDHRVRIHAGDPDPRCTVLTRTGEIVARGLTLVEVAERMPSFPLDRLHAAVEGESGGDTLIMQTPHDTHVPGLDD